MAYITVRQAAYIMGVTPRRIRQLLVQGRIAGSERFGTQWAIPMTEEGDVPVSRGKRGIPLRIHREARD